MKKSEWRNEGFERIDRMVNSRWYTYFKGLDGRVVRFELQIDELKWFELQTDGLKWFELQTDGLKWCELQIDDIEMVQAAD